MIPSGSVARACTALAVLVAAVVGAGGARTGNGPIETCRTRFTFTRPTRENASSILFGGDCDGERSDNREEASFNHNEVGITRPVEDGALFPSCAGYSEGARKRLNVDGGGSDAGAATVRASASIGGWRCLRFVRRVGRGRGCYERVRGAVLDWDFRDPEGRRGVVSASAASDGAGPRSASPRRGLLATFAEVRAPKPLKSLFVVNPVRVVYEVKDATTVPRDIFSSTAYATLEGHLLVGEERVTVVWRECAGDEVYVEIVSFSRASPSIGGRLVWPLIGRMQRGFFLAEMDHLDGVANGLNVHD